MAVRDVVNHLPDRPASRPVRALQIGIAQRADEGSNPSGCVFERLQEGLASGTIQPGGNTLKPANGITQGVEVGHNCDQYHEVKSPREETFMWKRSMSFGAAIIFLTTATHAAQQQPSQPQQRQAAPPSIEERTTGMQKMDGYFPLYWDERSGSLFIEIPRFDTEFLFSTGLSAGLGSNDIGLDRGAGGSGRIVVFQRVGPRVLMVQPNESFRSSSSSRLERKAVEDSFAKSVLWGFSIAAETGGRVLVDGTDFLLRDVFDAASALRPGTYRVDRARSAFYLPDTKNFPRNTEIDMTLTFGAEPAGGRGGGGGPVQGPPPIGEAPAAGRETTFGGGRGGLFSGTVASVTPTADAVTLREHVSMVQLPDNNYKPRADDPRAGYGAMNFVDYSVPIGEPIVVRYIRRHRLEKRDPSAAVSDPVNPIQYWVDPGAPQDVRQALIEGASWWNQAFEAAGFRNAF